MKIVISGRIPSKKNSRLTFARGNKIINIPSKAYASWHKDALEQLSSYSGGLLEDIEKVTLSFWAPDKRSSDLSNKTESIMDLLVDKGILKDDNWFIVPRLELVLKGIDRVNPRCEIDIVGR